ncbi:MULTISPECIES: TonB-dependent hemoglobin/transferrin/lactoferrin family receptor [Pseudoalteromonas]|uniref:Ligand-gated channel protein n=1 Tax=Pseudoalteromonas tetraodonis GFC TaxID=1315271 RepID=A0AA37S5C4_9GAMM|nr:MULTISPECIES: TonB-dependent hemoglobin/transferrin/lactoferrin family receptor [Pseudoalteromonas]ATD04778.1 hemoglobin/transferrin/lactoferrin receptor protein [Pseudoalteromonas tetraodonis]MDN3413983.1 TonB-dependent hemoglobin/transferrin/lactoferrin family receptor [Pseudoalteromonas sp. APC 3250]TMP51528.1 TonB-dependent hemoglobin/transferrin/lactoferrin family receptor [Pseudoalteromonas sp. S1688]TMS92215.1 TonB-dependent hemoglobin/transferrin/lactoferrin family receptor [Pseudoal
MNPFSFKFTALASLLISSGSALAENVIDDHIVVSGSRFEQKLEDVTGSVTVITEQDIERQLAVDLQTMFKYDPSISSTGSGAGAQTLTVRGVGGNRVVFIKDGRRTNDGYAGGGGYLVGRNYFDVAGVKQVEVAKGAASSLYGSDALGGIVVITTKDPSDYLVDQQSLVKVALGYQGQSNQVAADITAAKDLGDFAISAVYSHRDSEEVQNYVEDLPGYDARSDALLLKVEQKLDEKRTLKYTLDYFNQTTEQVITPSIQETEDEDTNISFALDYDSDMATAIFDKWYGQLSYSRYEQQSDQISAARNYIDYNDYGFEQDILGLKAVFSKEVKGENTEHEFVYGIDIDLYDTTRPRLKTRVLNDGTVDFTNEKQKAFPGADTSLVGVYMQDSIKFNETDWSLVAGIRYDYYALEAKKDALYADIELDDITESAFSPKLGVIYQVDDNLSWYGQYVRGFKIPPHDQAYQSHGVEPFYQILPNADLDPESSDSFEIGLRYASSDISVNLSTFYAAYDDFIETTIAGVEPTYIPNVNKTFYQYQNISETQISGVEAGIAMYVTDDILLEANVAYVDGENKDSDQPLTSISPLNGSILVSTEFGNVNWTAAWRLAKAQSDVVLDTNGNKTTQGNGYGVVDLYANYQWQAWQMNVGLLNLLDKEYVPFELIAGQSKGTDFSQYSQPGRNVSARISYQF